MVKDREVGGGASNLKHGLSLADESLAYGERGVFGYPLTRLSLRRTRKAPLTLPSPEVLHALQRCFREAKGARGPVVQVNAPLCVDDDPDAPRRSACARSLRRAIGQAHGPVGVAEEREVEPKEPVKVGVALLGVKAHAEDACVLGRELIQEAAEPAALEDSARGRCLGIKPQHQVVTGVVGEGVWVPLVIKHREIRSGIANLQHASFLGQADPQSKG